MDNIIYVFINENNEWTLKFSNYNIEAKAYIGKNGITKDKREGDGKGEQLLICILYYIYLLLFVLLSSPFQYINYFLYI